MATYKEFHQYSIEKPNEFWTEQAQLIDWKEPFTQVCDYSRPPFSKWFVGGKTNLCHNAVDRHAAKRPDANALIFVSTETDEEKVYSFAELQREVERMAAIYQSLGVKRGDRVLIYMPMIAQACFAILAATRIGAIHSVVFGGFASGSLATRIDDAKPVLIVSSDAGMRGGKAVPYKHLLDEAIELSENKPAKVLMIDRGLDKGYNKVAGRDVDYATLRAQFMDAKVPCEWMESNEPSYILYTSGTTGKPKGVQRDTGGYAVALASTMKHIYCGGEGETFFSTSDIGWVVGHSYIIYGPLIAGMATIMYEGTPLRPDAGIWWQIVEKYKVNVMFSAPTAARVLKKQDPAYMHKYDLSSLKHIFMAGEPLDQPTHEWFMGELGIPVIDNYWQTETGWPMLAALPGVEKTPIKYGSPSFPVYGYNLQIFREDGSVCGPNEKGIAAVIPPLPPGCLSTVWGQDDRFVSTYFTLFKEPLVYSSYDWAIKDEDGYFTILGRTDDVINVAGHRLGTREIEEAIQAHAAIAEVAVVGVEDKLKGQMPMAFAVVKDASKVATPEMVKALEKEVFGTVDSILGAIARPARVHFVTGLPKTRSGKMLRRSLQALAEGRDPGDLTTIEDPSTLEQIKNALAG
ncbi:propionate--CoA ligase [Dechloromonas sp. XY25]|uniref:Propionate--CoA ligase n=1 Tax=Dechloromonas hankyongensis TaxID=2908002 RepID=A0ABS9K1W1_9RHOO|nr:propionate--CoA ligase [Dechloromonas hankyongensis]MCG2577074.1 propionate--CoA ligase [Dechloromonas hankyongensis]